MAIPISVAIPTKNSGRYIRECLKSVAEFDEVIILDNGSTDETIEIAAAFPNVKVFRSEFIGFGPLRNLAASYAIHDWILRVDSDEVITRDLSEEIRNLSLEEDKVYLIPRENYYNQKLIKCCGWYPDSVLRLYHRQRTCYEDKMVHENIIVHASMKVVPLRHCIRHYAYDSASQLIGKMNHYVLLYASDHRGKKKSSPRVAVLHALFCFIKTYFFQRGFLYGYEGLLISVSDSVTVFYKYVVLLEENRNLAAESTPVRKELST